MTAVNRADDSTRLSELPAETPHLVVADAELRDIWLTVRGPGIVLIFSLLLSSLTYLTAANEELNILDQRDTVNLVLQITMGAGIALVLLFSADAVSGERERQTLENLLTAPITGHQIATGKLLAALSIWPVILLVSIPYVWSLRREADVFVDSVLAAALVGTILAVAFSCFGLALSIMTDSNRVSLSVSLFAFVALMAPTQLPGGLKGWFGDLFVHVNPVTAGSRFLERLAVNNQNWDQELSLLIAPVVACVLGVGLLYLVSRRIALQSGSRA